MKKPKVGAIWYFVDESGDLTFFDRHGNNIIGQNDCSSHLIVGFARIPDPASTRKAVVRFHRDILSNSDFQGIASLKKTTKALHAKDDHPSIRDRFFKYLTTLNFQCQCVVARKDEHIFRRLYHGKELVYYDHLVARLFEDVMHLYEHNNITFARRYKRDRNDPMRRALDEGKERFERRCGKSISSSVQVSAQSPSGEPCLSITDYMLWAVQRGFTRDDWHYYKLLEDKLSLLRILDNTNSFARKQYNRKFPLSDEIERDTPSVLDLKTRRTA